MLDKAKAMLRTELVKQPLLSVFFTTETWRLPLVPALVEAGYLTPSRTMETAAGTATVNDVTDKAREELVGADLRSALGRS